MLNTLIVDDEAPARRRLRKLLAPMVESGRVSIRGEAGDGVEALDFLRERPVDLLFLDVKMPEMDGFALLERLEADVRPVVVFTTAFDEYALRAFETNAVDYLLKPISMRRLEDAVTRSERARRSRVEIDADAARIDRLLEWIDRQKESEPRASSAAAGSYLKQLSVPYRDRILVVPVDRIVAIEIVEGITRVLMLNDRSPGAGARAHEYVVSYTLDQLESNLDPDAFMRVHRSSIVQVAKIREMIPWFSGRYKLLLEGEHEVVASRERSRLLKEKLMI